MPNTTREAAAPSFLQTCWHFADLDAAEQAKCRADVAQIGEATEQEVETLLDGLIALAKQASPGQATGPHEPLLAALLEQLSLRYRRQGAERQPRQELSGRRLQQISDLYAALAARGRNARHHLLRVLTGCGTPEALEKFVELVVADGPDDAKQADLAFVPLFQHAKLPVEALFPGLLRAILNPAVAVQVFDLANYVTRRGLVSVHPTAGRLKQLLTLCSGVVNRLQDFEHKPEGFGSSPQEISQMVGRCVELLVALCDALALIGDQRAIGKLRQMLELRHRRLRTEAAAALARLGDKTGIDALVGLAAEPSVRRRAAAYLKELGETEKLPPELCSDIAVAEGELASWLAEPAQIGLAPQRMELLDRRTQPWPGFAEPVVCFLFRFEYDFPRGTFRGVGITGPVVHASAADLTKLPPEDIYAIYAGWHAEHAEISEIDVQDFGPDQADEAEAVLRELEDIGYEEVRVVKLGRVLDQRVAVASAVLAGEPGVVITADDKMRWCPAEAHPSLGANEIYCLFKGRLLMSAFQQADPLEFKL
jgi:hypothetical protein